ncbi:MAG: AI-2E family transporter [Lachnospirales bacterium]
MIQVNDFVKKVGIFIASIIILILGYKLVLFLFAPFIVGYIISWMLRPIFNICENKFKLNKGLSAALSLVFFVVIIGSFIALLIQAIVSQSRDLIANYETIYVNVIVAYDKVIYWLDEFIYILPNFIEEFSISMFSNLLKGISTYFVGTFKELPQNVFEFAKSAVSIIIMGCISSYFFMRDRELVAKVVRKYTPVKVKEYLLHFKNSGLTVISGYVSTQLKLMSVTFTIALISLIILGIKYSLLIAIGIAIIDVLPFFGSGFFLWPMGVYYLINQQYFIGVSLFVTYVIILLTRQFLEPRFLGEKLEIHPLLLLMSMYIGLRLIGFFGLIVGPFMLIVAKQFFAVNEKMKSNVEKTDL